MSSTLKKWILLSGNRYGVASVILVLMTSIVCIPAIAQLTIRNISPLYYIGSGLITGNITLITVVVAINQVILSQELQSPGTLRDQIERTAEYRQEALNEPTAPTNPSNFLQDLYEQTHRRTELIETLLPEETDDVEERLLVSFLNHCKQISDQFEQTPNNLSNTIVPLLDVEYGVYRDNRQSASGLDPEGECRNLQ